MMEETERKGGRERGGEEGPEEKKGRGGGVGLDSYSNTKEHVQIV